MLRDPRFAAASIPPAADAAFRLLARWMIRLDGDRHRRVRDAFGGLFTARRVKRYRAIIAERAAILIDQAGPAGSMDLVADFARPLPFTVVTEVLGVPPDDRDWLAAEVAALNRGFARQRDSDRTAIQAANDAAGQLLSYFAGLPDQRSAAQRQPTTIGAPLARLHGEVALSTLFTRLPGLAARTPPAITASVPIRQVGQFLVSWPQHRPAPGAPPHAR